MKPDDGDPGILKRNLEDFARACAAKKPVPGGGAVACYTGSLGAALAEMAIAYSIKKDDSDRARLALLNEGIDYMNELRETLLRLSEEDSKAYGAYAKAAKMPKDTTEDAALRQEALQAALVGAMEPPLEGAKQSLAGMKQLAGLATMVSKRLITDVGVAAHCLDSALRSCWYNVIINVNNLKDKKRASDMTALREEMEAKATKYKAKILKAVEKVL